MLFGLHVPRERFDGRKDSCEYHWETGVFLGRTNMVETVHLMVFDVKRGSFDLEKRVGMELSIMGGLCRSTTLAMFWLGSGFMESAFWQILSSKGSYNFWDSDS